MKTNQSMQRMRACRLGLYKSLHQRRLALTADARRSATAAISMRLNATGLRWFFSIGLLLTPASFASEAIPPTRDQAVGIWVGYSNHLEFIRLELNGNGTGYLSLGSLGDDGFDIYRLKSWALKEWNITVQVVPVTRSAEGIKFDNIGCYAPYLEVEFSGTTNDWSRKAQLWDEHAFKKNAKRAADAVAKARKKG